MKKVFALALAVLMVLGMFAGCGVKDAGKAVLKVALSPDFAPMESWIPPKPVRISTLAST